MTGRRALGPPAHPRLTWAVFAATCTVGLGAALVAVIPSGDRITIGLTFWGGVVVIAVAATVLLPARLAAALPRPGRALGSPGGGGGYRSDGSRYRGTWL